MYLIWESRLQFIRSEVGDELKSKVLFQEINLPVLHDHDDLQNDSYTFVYI